MYSHGISVRYRDIEITAVIIIIVVVVIIIMPRLNSDCSHGLV